MTAALVLRGGRVVTPDGVVDADVVVHGTRIHAVEPPRPRGEQAHVIELAGRWVLPGFVDVHVHGGGGAQCNTTDPDEVRRVASFHAQHGTTALLATTVSAPVDDLLAALDAIGTAAAAPAPGAADILGAHLEGPFLSRDWPGAMDPAHFRPPDAATAERLLTPHVRLITLAPELPGAAELIATATAQGIAVSLGHSGATYAQTRAATEAGARAATHAFNAMRPLHHREPGILGAALDLDALTTEVIADGHHVAPAAVRLLTRLKGPHRTMLVTDAIEAAGLPDGDYRLGARPIHVVDGQATLPGTETIAGSTLTMDAAVRNVVAFAGVEVEDAARMAATTPAEMLGIADRKGAVAPGRDADLAILDRDLTLAAVLTRGTWARSLTPAEQAA